jgi:hypothetical protein
VTTISIYDAHALYTIITDAFKYWGGVPTLTTYTDEAWLKADYESQSGETHWFDPETLRFFGSRNREMVAPGLMVECQTNSPSDKYVVVAWVYKGIQYRITPQVLRRFPTRKQAKEFALAASSAWPTGKETS